MDYNNASNGYGGYDAAYDNQAPQDYSSFPPGAEPGVEAGGGGGGGGAGSGRDMIQNTVAQGLEQFKSAGSHLADVTHLNDPETKMAATR